VTAASTLLLTAPRACPRHLADAASSSSVALDHCALWRELMARLAMRLAPIRESATDVLLQRDGLQMVRVDARRGRATPGLDVVDREALGNRSDEEGVDQAWSPPVACVIPRHPVTVGRLGSRPEPTSTPTVEVDLRGDPRRQLLSDGGESTVCFCDRRSHRLSRNG